MCCNTKSLSVVRGTTNTIRIDVKRNAASSD